MVRPDMAEKKFDLYVKLQQKQNQFVSADITGILPFRKNEFDPMRIQ